MTNYSIIRDVAERKQPEEALMEERHLLHTLMDNLPDKIYFKDRDSRFTQINLSLANAFGLNHPSQAVGKTDFDFYSAEHAELAYRDEQEIVRTGQPIVGKEEKETWPDGSVTWVSTTKMALRDSSGKIIGTFGVSRDVTLRKRAEDAIREGELRYRSLLSNIPDIAWTVDDKLRFAFIGDNIEMVSGYSRAEIYERGAQIYLESLHPEDVQKVRDGFRALFATGRPFDVECRLKRKDGAWIWVHDRAIATYEKDGIRYADGLISDITERKRAEAEMAERHRLSILVAEVGGVLTRAESLRQGLQECAEILARSIGAAFARIWTVNEEENVLELQASAGIYTHINGSHARVPVGKSKIGRIAESGVPHLTNSVQEDSWVGDAEWARREGMVAFAGYPLKIDEHVLGVVAAFARQPLTETTLQAITSVADAGAQFIKRKRAEEALRLTQFSLDRAILPTFWADPDGKFTYVNDAACDLLGYSRPELLSMTVPDVAPDCPAEAWRTGWQNVKAAGSSMFETQERSKTGRMIPVEITTSYVQFDGREFACAFVRDITARKHAEEQTRLQTAALDSAANSIAIVSREGRILWVNPAFTRLTGYSALEVIGENPRLLKSGVHNNDLYQKLWQTILSGEAWRGELVNRRKDGTLYTEEMTITPVRDAEGTISHFVAIKQDITARKQAEKDLRLTQFSVEHAADGVFWMDSQGRIVYVNEAACKSLGCTREEVLSLSVPDIDPLVPEENWGTVWAQIKARGSMTFESQHQTKLGRVFPVEVTANYLEFDGKEYSFAFAHDITERREVERTKAELVSVVSHELRTPLTSIRGALGLLAGGLLRSQPEKGERMLEIAVSNTDRLVRLINDILDLERMESGKMNMEKQTCNAAQLMTQAVDSVRDLAEKAGVTLSVTTQSVRLWGDPDRIIQAFINLLSNAIKFSPQGRTIWFSAALQADVILFEVKDNGRGIPHEKQESIFERFQQVDASDRREKGGTGLGLPITRSIAQQHGGRVWVRSTEGQGSTFFLTLPLIPAETASVNDGRGDKSVLGKANDGPRVLVVEDDPDLARVLTTVFERHGAVVVNARTGQEAVQVCPQFIPDLLVLDVMLPEIDGFGVVEQLRKHERLQHLPVAVYSVKELDNSERARLRLGESIFMTKSRLTPQEFEERAIGLLNWARSGCKERQLR